ncbi:MAG: hypoxanthine phosphoribosyltransferase [Candidatus Neomarinimicrobiota bacterium]|jgi:hypoxanthine phosphoribosyltransferase|nr:MAG: hypoxanthine phosphoribosyltransferase [Candidatus Neomarinimicrobiota bacterium]HIA86480.1 hypoxanthine phosphoribosyltransferase [Candidatus Neomarinimicrobiota bacterium]HIB57844.1 hypoxanthine phosphoribosyltransferase [Candidatus Neomarinimicrobiota bacterium]HIC51827.1 hypoxanthine phosphoribosyltransferase [Candidatus Neomarinimicrobiota bacterium]HIM83417.1 hypoxanthine phosphoribosyltransferase [Candidatus Neomarinimicrobiota bacterium]
MRELISADQIAHRVQEMGAEISRKYEGRVPIFVGILNGSFIFMADLLREVSIECEVDFIKLSSYEGKTSSGTLHLRKDISSDVNGRDVIIVEDIVDSGLTINFLKSRIEDAGPSSVAVVSLLFKREVAELNFDLDYVGFEIPADYVVGYGLDMDQKKRNLKGIFSIEDELKGVK